MSRWSWGTMTATAELSTVISRGRPTSALLLASYTIASSFSSNSTLIGAICSSCSKSPINCLISSTTRSASLEKQQNMIGQCVQNYQQIWKQVVPELSHSQFLENKQLVHGHFFRGNLYVRIWTISLCTLPDSAVTATTWGFLLGINSFRGNSNVRIWTVSRVRYLDSAVTATTWGFLLDINSFSFSMSLTPVNKHLKNR